jgi:hypothetical protein
MKRGAGSKRDATKRQHLISLSYNVTKRVANRWRLLYLWLWIQQLLKVQGSPCHTTQDRSVGPGQFIWHTHQQRRMRNGKLNRRFGQTQRGRAQSRFDDPTDLAKATTPTQRSKQKNNQSSRNIPRILLLLYWQ